MTRETSGSRELPTVHEWVPNVPLVGFRRLPEVTRGGPAWLEDDRWVPPGERVLLGRAKDGLREVLDGLEGDGPVLLPTYVPAGLPATVEAAGYDASYYPVGETLSLQEDVVEDCIATHQPSAILFVHYFGFVDPAYPTLRRRASDADALVIEDAARGLFGRDENDELLGSTGDVALFCPHKTLPAPNGGLLVRRDGGIHRPNRRCRELFEPVKVIATKILGPRRSVSPPASDAHEEASPGVPASESCVPGWVSRRGFELQDPETVQSTRLDRYRELRGRLADQVTIVTPAAPDGSAPYGVGVLASSIERRNEALVRLRTNGLPAQVLPWPAYHEEVSRDAGATALRRRLLVLPTHQQVHTDAIPLMAETVLSVLEE